MFVLSESISNFQHNPFTFYHVLVTIRVFSFTKGHKLSDLKLFFFLTGVLSDPQPWFAVPPNCTDVSLRFTCG